MNSAIHVYGSSDGGNKADFRCKPQITKEIAASGNVNSAIQLGAGGRPDAEKILDEIPGVLPFAEPLRAFREMGAAPEPASAAWHALTAALGLESAAEGQRVSASGGGTPLAGTVDQAGRGEGHHYAFLLRLEEPAPGIASLFALPMAGQVFLVIDFFFYGDGASAAAARAEPPWSAWMNERFPLAAGDAQ